MRRLLTFLRRLFGREPRTPRLLDDLAADREGKAAPPRQFTLTTVDRDGTYRAYEYRDGAFVPLDAPPPPPPPPDRPA